MPKKATCLFFDLASYKFMLEENAFRLVKQKGANLVRQYVRGVAQRKERPALRSRNNP
jgi:hypothetical protein